MVEFMRRVAIVPQELSLDERNLLSVAYKNSVGARRLSPAELVLELATWSAMKMAASEGPLHTAGDAETAKPQVADSTGNYWRLLPPFSKSDYETERAKSTQLGEEEIWRDTMAKLILKLQDGASGKKSASEIQKLQELQESSPERGTRRDERVQGQQGSSLDKECWQVMPAVEAAMSAVSIAQAAAERQCAKAKEAEIEAQEKERLALNKTSEAAEEVARARAIVIEAQQTSAAAAHLRASEQQFAEQAAEKLFQQLSQRFAEQVEVKLAKAEARRAELEENSAELALKRRQAKMQEIQAAQEIAECKMKDREEALEVAIRSAERRAQNRLLDANALAISAEEQAKARAKAADEQADEAIRLAQKRVDEAEIACNVRIGRTEIAEMAAEQNAATASWANLMKDLPLGLEDRLFAAETFLQRFKVGAGLDSRAIDALRRARETHGKIASQTQPLAAAFTMTWGVLLAIALDTVLQLFLAAQAPAAASNETEQPLITSDKSCLSQTRFAMNVLSDQRHFEETQHAEEQTFASQRVVRDGDWDRLSEVGYDPEAETREQTAAEQHSDLEGVLDETRGRQWHVAPAAKNSAGNVSMQELKEGMSLNAQSLPLESTRRDHLLTSSTETWLQDTKHDASVDSRFVFLTEGI
eukprot:s1104_g34.t1